MELDWLKQEQRTFLQKDEAYIKQGDTPEKRYARIASTIGKMATKMAQTDLSRDYCRDLEHRFTQYIEKGWISFATPVLRNFGEPDNLPISCNQSIVGDSLDSIYMGLHEIGMLAKHGAGTSQNFSGIRGIGSEISTGGKSNSVMDWVELYADMMSKTAQNASRRGFLTAYLSVDHPEILDFLEIGRRSLPKEKQRFLNTITTGVTLPIGWRDDLPTNKDKQKIWKEILHTRNEAGFPYIVDLTNANSARPQVYKDKNLYIKTCNICSEIFEFTSTEKTFACCLSAVNLLHFNDFVKSETFITDCIIMLDCVIQEYIEKGSEIKGLEKAVRFAKEHRAVGLGTMGFQSYLQENDIVLGSIRSYQENTRIFSHISEKANTATEWLGKHFGEPEMLLGYGRRNTTTMAQAPNKSTSFIMGGTNRTISEGIDVLPSNYFVDKKAKIMVTIRNTALVGVLEDMDKNTKEVWDSILKYNGSVQHLDFLTEHQKLVFRTSYEIPQMDLINLAAQRQQYIDQGQSLNLMIHPNMSGKDVHELHMAAFEKGLKSLYYQKSINEAQEFRKNLLTCTSCEG